MSEASRAFRAAVLVSGGGSTALNLIACAERAEIPIHIAVVVAHRNDIPAVKRCGGVGREMIVIPEAPSPQASDQLDAALQARGVELVLLAGYLRAFRVDRWIGRTLNIHPALLPAFGGHGMYGERVHNAVLAAKARESGCTVHLVDDQYDHGEILVQRRVVVCDTDDSTTLARRVFEQECLAYPEAIRIWASRQP
ncbi:MAG: phosphoribosylglycinamide formyltransferase [Phycisphaerales bacterium]|nr:phosphoribosylglycinamide formyltransferase [Phycisphaerales bacterium]